MALQWPALKVQQQNVSSGVTGSYNGFNWNPFSIVETNKISGDLFSENHRTYVANSYCLKSTP